MNHIPPLRLPSITAEVLVEGVILEPKKGRTLSEHDCAQLALWLTDALSPLKVELFVEPTAEPSHGFPLHD